MARLDLQDSLLYDCTSVRGRVQVHNIGSTLQRIPNHGHAVLNSTGGVTVLLAAPVPGCRVTITKGTTSTASLVVNTTGQGTAVTLNNAGNTNITFDAVDDTIELEGRTALRWHIVSSTAIALS